MLTHVEKVTVLVNSQAEARAFWTEKVGFVVAMEQPMGPNATWLEVAPLSSCQTTLVLYDRAAMPPEAAPAGHPLIMFATDDAEGAWAQLRANGVKVSPILAQPYGKMFHFEDHEGNSYTVRG